MKVNIFKIMQRRRAQQGFTLLEVVIAMALGAGGVIAFAGLQLKAIEIASEARDRSTAAFIAAEMAERMMSNSQDFNAQVQYQIGADWNVDPTDHGKLVSENLCALPADCNVAQVLASRDIQEIKDMTRGMLINGDIWHKTCGDNLDMECIVVAWNDAADDIQNCALVVDGSGVTDCYILQVKIW